MSSSGLHKRVLHSGIGGSGLPPKGPSRAGVRSRQGKRDYSPLTWDAYFSEKAVISTNSGDHFAVYCCGSQTGPLVVLLHGGGFSALTWSLFAAELTRRVQCQILAIDLRGHGETETSNDQDLSADILSKDITDIIRKAKEGKENTPVLLIGHSMGGALAVHAALSNEIDNLVGICVIDVVEGN